MFLDDCGYYDFYGDISSIKAGNQLECQASHDGGNWMGSHCVIGVENIYWRGGCDGEKKE